MIKKSNSGIYSIKNLKNNQQYIGSAVNYPNRFRQHKSLLNLNKHYAKHLQKSWNKHGSQNFIFELILCCSKENLLEFEQYFLDKLAPVYNTLKIAGSRLGTKASLETLKKLSDSHKGKPSPNKGIKTGKPSWNRGIPQTEETKLKLSKASKGKHYSPKSEFKKGERNKKLLRKIECVDLELSFLSIADAARFCGNVNYMFNIANCARGKQPTAYGYKWKLID